MKAQLSIGLCLHTGLEYQLSASTYLVKVAFFAMTACPDIARVNFVTTFHPGLEAFRPPLPLYFHT